MAIECFSLFVVCVLCMQCTHLSTILYNIEHIYKIYQIQFLSFSHSINLSISISQSALSQHVYCIVYTQSTAQSTTPAFRPFVWNCFYLDCNDFGFVLFYFFFFWLFFIYFFVRSLNIIGRWILSCVATSVFLIFTRKKKKNKYETYRFQIVTICLQAIIMRMTKCNNGCFRSKMVR